MQPKTLQYSLVIVRHSIQVSL